MLPLTCAQLCRLHQAITPKLIFEESRQRQRIVPSRLGPGLALTMAKEASCWGASFRTGSTLCPSERGLRWSCRRSVGFRGTHWTTCAIHSSSMKRLHQLLIHILLPHYELCHRFLVTPSQLMPFLKPATAEADCCEEHPIDVEDHQHLHSRLDLDVSQRP